MVKLERGPCCIASIVILVLVFIIGIAIIIISTHLFFVQLQIQTERTQGNDSYIYVNTSKADNTSLSYDAESPVPIEVVPEPVYKSDIVIGAVVCRKTGDYGPREETAVMIKSVLISALLHKNVSFLDFQIFIEFQEDKDYFLWKLLEFGHLYHKDDSEFQVNMTFHSVTDAMPKEYLNKMMYTPIRCGYVRCFFPEIFRDVDSLLYLDTDVIVTGNVADIWAHLTKMKGEQLIGVGMDFEPDNPNFDKEHNGAFGDIPIPTTKGLNSGVLLMNLTRMRENKWVEKAIQVWFDYGMTRTMEDQRLINILLFYDSGLLHLLPCNYNYRPGACILGLYCNASRTDPLGIQVIHQWYDPRWVDDGIWNTFWEIAQIYQNVNLTDPNMDIRRDLMTPARNAYRRSANDTQPRNPMHGKCDGILDRLLFTNYFQEQDVVYVKDQVYSSIVPIISQ